MTRLVLAIATLAVPVLAATSALAGQPMATDDAEVAEPGEVDVEMSSAASGPVAGEPMRLELGLANHVGATRGLEAIVALHWTVPVGAGDASGGLGEPTFSAKARLHDQAGSAPALAIRIDYQPALGLPASSGGMDVGAVAVASWTIRRLTLSANLGAHAASLGTSRPTLPVLAAVTVAQAIRADVTIAVEAVVEGLPRDVHELGTLAGVAWRLSDAVALSAGVGAVLTGWPAIGWTATVGLTTTVSSGG